MEPRAFWRPLDRAELPVLEWVERTRLGGAVEEATRAITKAGEHGLAWYAIAGASAAADVPRRERWLRAGASVAGVYAASTALKLIARRQRPPVAALGTKTGLSFPSSHATTSFAAARLMSSIEPRGKLGYYGLAAAFAGSRLHFCVHYPSDIVAGALLGDLAGRALTGACRC